MGEQPPDPLFTLRGDMAPIHCLMFQIDSDSEYLYAATQSGIIHKWNLMTSREESQVKVGEGCCLAVRRLDQLIITQEKGGVIRVWECQNKQWRLRNEVCSEYWGFCKMDLLGDELIACPGPGSTVSVMTTRGTPTCTLSPPTSGQCGEIMALKCVNITRTDYVFVLYENGTLVLFDNSGSKVSEIRITKDCPMALDFREGKGVVGSSGDVVQGFTVSQELRLDSWKQVRLTNPGVSCLAMRGDGRVLAAGCWDGRVRLFSLRSLKLLAVVGGGSGSLQALVYSPSPVASWRTDWLLAAATDDRLTLWSLF